MKKIIFQFCIFLKLFNLYCEQSLSEKFESLHGISYIFHNLNLSEGELEAFKSIQLDKMQDYEEYENYGKLENLEKDLHDFFMKIGEQNQAKLELTIQTLIKSTNDLLVASKQPTAWFCIRAFHPCTSYQIPRWHQDGKYFNFDNPNPRLVSKCVLVLKGSPTLFANLPDEVKRLIDSYHNEERVIVDQIVQKYKIESPKSGEVALFRVGDEKGAVHSEPNIKTDRLFISILPGSYEEIDELYNNWHPKEP